MNSFPPSVYFQQVYQLSMQSEYVLQNLKLVNYTDEIRKARYHSIYEGLKIFTCS